MERQDCNASSRNTPRQLIRGSSNLSGSRQETKDCSARVADGVGSGLLHRDARPVGDVERKLPAWDSHHWTVTEIARYACGIDRRRHHDEPEIRPRTPGLARKRQPDIGVNTSFVELIDHDRRKRAGERILLEASGQDAFRRNEQLRGRAEVAIETDLPSHLVSESPALFGSDAPRDCPRRHSSRLQQEDIAVRCQRGRHSRRLSGARRGRHDNRAMTAERALDRANVFIDWQWEHPQHR